ncbi:glycosyltransferase family 39 protein, partial [Serendipita vermifera MAFF 305830]
MGADEKLDAVRGGAPATRTFATPASRGTLGKIGSGEFKVLIAVVLVACAVRLFRLGKPNSVVFDEVHFGKFAAKYIRTRYYVDVHPPLAKLLLTLASFVWGFDGSFEFKDIGAVYPSNVPYVPMRFLPAILGVALVPITHLTLRELGCGASTALLGSVLVLFENGLVTQSRHILLDSPLLFFTGLSTLFWVMFCNEDRKPVTKIPDAHTTRASHTITSGPFSRIWWIYLTLTGLALGAVVSCKWVGLFTIATVGCSTIKQLWTLLGDTRVSPALWIRHFFARAVCLILVPLMFYMSMFKIHFAILRNSGDGDAFMSSEFQHTLDGKEMRDTYADVAFNSVVTIRHVNTQGGYLHSHTHNYPGGSKQQQITLYPHIDSN